VRRLFCALAVALCLSSCQQPEKPKPPPVVVGLPPGTTIAVAPPINASGSADLDTVKVADAMASELSGLPGLGVIGVNRVLAVLADQGTTQIQSPTHAQAVCERLGADCILVMAVTEYDPYRPVVGLVAELYGAGAGSEPGGALSRPTPKAQVQRVFNAAHASVQKQVEEYAEHREAYKTPMGWKRYLASQSEYLRFCCYSVARELVQ
jgi:hypothetical protein